MRERTVHFKRITYGTKPDDSPWLATILENVLIPDYDLEICNKEELEIRYSWKQIALAAYIRRKVRRTGEYTLDLKTKDIGERTGPMS